MHPRSPYNDAPNFAAVAEAVPFLEPHLKLTKKGQPTIDFKDPEALRCLTRALLLYDFELDVDLPNDRLCPPVAGRLDYVLYMQDVIQHHRRILRDTGTPNDSTIVGLDIGVGASAIYPLLFTSVDKNVCMIGTDIDNESLLSALHNVEKNNLQARIRLFQTEPEAGFFEAAIQANSYLDFTMCNPPFYVSEEEMAHLTSEKEDPPSAICTGAPNEMVALGGEVAFVRRMVYESRLQGDRIAWFSSLLGKATSVISIVKELTSIQCTNYGLIETSPSHTHRWIIFWTWSDVRLPDTLARHLPLSSALTKSLPLPNDLSYYCPKTVGLAKASTTLTDFLASLDLQALAGKTQPSSHTWLVVAQVASWTRAARRNRSKPQPDVQENSNARPLLTCELTLRCEDANERQVELSASWIRGSERQSFESFFSTCVRKVARAAPLLQQS